MEALLLKLCIMQSHSCLVLSFTILFFSRSHRTLFDLSVLLVSHYIGAAVQDCTCLYFITVPGWS